MLSFAHKRILLIMKNVKEKVLYVSARKKVIRLVFAEVFLQGDEKDFHDILIE